MATAKKLPGGSYRVRVYDNDSKKYKSFTAPTKKLVELAVSPTCVWLFHEMFCGTGNAFELLSPIHRLHRFAIQSAVPV